MRGGAAPGEPRDEIDDAFTGGRTS
jgi:hypothetical protein